MPNDVGVLQLSIEDNSKQAAGGLQELGKALSSVKTALSGGLNLPTQSVKNFAAAVASNSKALSSTGTFLNAVKEYQKAFKDVGKVKIDTTPITELQTVLKDGIKIGQAGTQLSKLREAFTGDWGKVGESGEEINSAVAGMKAIKDMGDEFKSSGTAQNIKEVAEAIAQYTRAQKDMPSGGAHDLYGMFGGAKKAASSGTGKSRLPLGEYMQFFGNGTQSSGQISMFERISDEIQEVTNDFRTLDDTVAQQKWPSFGSALYENIKGIMDTPLEHLHDIYRTPTTSMEDYKNAADAVLPKVQKLSSEEMVMAGNAKRATAEISNLIKQLNSFGGPKGQALQGIIDVITGVSRGNAGGGMINASSTMFTPVKEMTESFSAIREATEGTIQIFDSASGAYHEMYVNCANIAESAEKATESVQQMNQSITEGIALADMPASGKNGVFANANEEFLYLTGQIEKARTETQQFFDIAMKAENQLKYGGPRSKEDLQFDYQHGIEGYERAIAAEEKYQDSLRGLMTYVQQTASEMRSAVTDTHEAPIEQAAAQVSEAMNRIGSSRGIVAAREEMQSFGIASGEATSKIELLRNRVEELKRSYSEISKMPAALFGGSDGKASALNNVALKIGRVNEQIEKLVQNAHKAQDAANLKQLQESITVPQHDNMQFVENMMNQYSEIDLLTIKMQGMKQALADDITQNRVDTQQIAQRTIAIQQLRDKIEELKKAQNETTRETKNSISGWKAFGNGIKAMFPTLSNLLKRFKSMIIMRSIRYLVRQLAAGMSEGIQNVYQYSKAIGGSFAPAMDEAATALQQMKNSIGAALAPAIQALIPILQTVVNWFINLVNYVNQFFALLNGQKTWTRALPATASAFDKQTKAAKGAGAAMKDLLADWDELNIIQSQSGGGNGAGSGTKAEDYLKMFEEVGRFDNKVKDIVDFIDEHIGTIKSDIKKAGAALLAWKFSNAFSGALATIAGLAGAIVTIGLVFDVSTMFTENYLETGNAGWLIGDLLTTFVGGFFAKQILTKVLGGAVGQVGIPLAFAVSAGATIKALVEDADVSALSEKSIISSVAAALEGGIAGGTAMYTIVKTTAGLATGVGVGTGLFTFGLAIGLKAIADTVDASEITQETIKANLLSAGSIGAGLAISTATILGSYATVGTIIGTFAGGAVLTLGALFAIEAILAAQPSRIAWGDERLTESEIQAFVDTKIFTFDVKANMELASEAVTITDDRKEKLRQAIRDLVKSVDAVRVGINEQESLEKIDEQVNGTGGIIDKFNELQLAKQNEIVIALNSVKLVDGDGKDINAETAKIFGAGWNVMDGVMRNLGSSLSKAVKDSYNENIDSDARDMAKQTVLSISQAMADIEAINTSNQTAISMRNKFKEGLGGIDQSSMSGLLNYYEQEQKQATAYAESQFQTILDEAELQQRNFEYLAQKALENGGEFGGYKYQDYIDLAEQYKTIYETMKEYREQAINASLEFYKEGGEGYGMLRDAMLEFTKNRDISIDAMWGSSQEVLEAYQELFSSTDSVLKGEKAGQNIKDHITNIILSAFHEKDRGEVRRALDTGILKYSDFINKEMTDQLADRLGVTGELKDIWDKYVDELLGGTNEATIDIKDNPQVVLPEGFDAKELIKTAMFGTLNAMSNFVIDVAVEIQPEVTVGNVEDELQKAVEEALKDNVITVDERNMLDFQFGANEVEKAIQQLYGNGMAKLTPVRLSASAGFNYSDSGYGNRSENEPILTEPKDPQAETANVAAGVQKGNVDVVNAIQTIIPILTQILQKESTVVVAPGSDWGRHNAKSNSAWNKMTGAISLEE